MKTSLFTVAFFAIFSLGFISTAYATVGGPNLIYDFRYSHADESVYYKVSDQGGRGCPTMLDKISLETEQVSDFYSCNDGEAAVQSFYNPSGPNGNYYPGGLEQVTKDITDIIKNFKPLTPLVLKNNDIEIDIQFQKPFYYGSAADNDVAYRIFNAIVYQRGVKVDQFEITGCSVDQPFLFQGYAIPGFNKKIIILSSAKGDCAEGGYIREKLHVIGGVDNLDKTDISHEYKTASALIPSESTLFVLEKDSIVVDVNTATTTPVVPDSQSQSTDEPMSKNLQYPIIIASILIILGVGFFMGKRRTI